MNRPLVRKVCNVILQLFCRFASDGKVVKMRMAINFEAVSEVS